MVLTSGTALKHLLLNGAVQDFLAMTTRKKCLCQIHNEEGPRCPVWPAPGECGLCSEHGAPAMWNPDKLAADI